ITSLVTASFSMFALPYAKLLRCRSRSPGDIVIRFAFSSRIVISAFVTVHFLLFVASIALGFHYRSWSESNEIRPLMLRSSLQLGNSRRTCECSSSTLSQSEQQV